MPDLALRKPIPTPLNRPKRAVKLPLPLQTALKAIIWEGQELDEAATIAGLTTHTVRCALAKPHVIKWMKDEREVLRAYVCGQNIHHLKEIRGAAKNMPAVNAIKLLEQLGDEAQSRGGGVSASPGVTIRIVNVVQQASGEQRHSEPERRIVDISKA